MFSFQYGSVTVAFENQTSTMSSFLNSEKTESSFFRFSESRNGRVLKYKKPVCISFVNPQNRVLLNRNRKCNPFFHLYESLWMLSGDNRVEPLKQFVKTIVNYSDDGKTFNGAYGYRWRHAQVSDCQNWEDGDGIDQIEILVDHLKNQPDSRRAVLQMWNVEDDLLKIGPEGEMSKDVCCNLSVLFSRQPGNKLDMTVFNRSNDLIWGLLGANVVHFSVLHEYMAIRLKASVGCYYQITNDLHVYLDNNSGFDRSWPIGSMPCGSLPVPLVDMCAEFDLEKFHEDLQTLKESWKVEEVCVSKYKSTFFNRVFQPMVRVWERIKNSESLENLERACNQMARSDWQEAARLYCYQQRGNMSNYA